MAGSIHDGYYCGEGMQRYLQDSASIPAEGKDVRPRSNPCIVEACDDP